ncbi:MAG: 3-keto-5-aminohexanoate cleavage protein, partial [Pseudomonadota bacterium]
MSKPTILSAAVTGSFGTPEQNPNLPVSPEQIADACIASAHAGAAICHVHVRDLETAKPSMNLDYYREVCKRIADDGTDMIINLTTGPGGRYMPSD